MGFKCAERTHVGLRRKLNEDALANLADKGLWVVADGMGGHEAGEVASGKVVAAMADLPAQADPKARADAAVLAVQHVNAELIDMAEVVGGKRRTIGTTVVGLAIEDGEYQCFWAGDSRAYRIRKGSIVQITRDHSLVQDLVDARMIEPDEAESHPNANVVTRAVGASHQLKVDQTSGETQSGDIFLLASDGLTRKVSQVEILAALYEQPIESAADRLLDMVLDRRAPDNVTMIIIQLD